MAKNRGTGADMLRRGSGAGQAYARMLRCGNFNQAVVYVEGISDIQFYHWMTDNAHVTLHQMTGKDAAMDAVSQANKRKTRGVLAIVDSDFDHLLNIGPDDNVIRTDTHDIETLMISEGAFQYVPARYIDETKLGNSKYDLDSLWAKLIEIASSVGRIRLLSKENNWNMKFSDGAHGNEILEISDVIKLVDGEIVFDEHQYIWECINAASNCSVDVRTAYKIYTEDKREFDTWQICRGHDLSLLISMLYSKEYLGKRNLYRDEIETLISSTFIASRKFKKTQMCRDIKLWQEGNIGWKILSDELM